MAIQTLETIKNWFRTSLKPTQQQFWDTWDSFRHKDDKITVEDIDGIQNLTPNIKEVLTKGNNYYTNGQNDYMRFTNQYAPGWEFNSMEFRPGGIRLEKSHGGNSDGILYAADHLGSLFSRSDYANEVGFKLSTDGLLLKTNIAPDGAGIIKSDNLIKTTDYQLPIESEAPSITLVSKVNGIPADVNGNVIVDTAGSQSSVSATESGIVNNNSLQELGGADKTINGVRIGKGNANYENNLVIGRNGLASVTTGQYNVAIGNGDDDVEGPLQYLTTGRGNAIIGSDSGINNTTGNYNTGVGTSSLFKNTTGSYNTAIGSGALYKNQFGSQNIAIGSNALRNNEGNDGSNIYGHRSIAIGSSAMQSNINGHGIAIGNFAMCNQTTGTHNISIGLQAGSGITTGNGNLVVAGTGFIQPGGGITTGNNNMIIAPNDGNTTGITTGNGNVILGKVTGLNAALENNIVISNGVGNVKAQNDGTNWKFSGQLNKTALDTAPESATAIGIVGEIRYTADYIYVCTASNKWVRSALTTW